MKIILAGYYGYRNWGDEGSLATLLQAIARGSDSLVRAQPDCGSDSPVRAQPNCGSDSLVRAQPDCGSDSPVRAESTQISVLSADLAFTEATYGVAAIPRMELRTVRRAILDSDALIFGGGSLLQDATSLRSLLYYLALIRWGLAAHGRVLLVGQGIGPLHRRISRVLTGVALRRTPFLSVRDAESAALVRALGVPHATLDADLTWALTPQPPHFELSTNARWIGLAPRLWRDAPVQEVFTALCRRIQADGYRALLIPMQETQDRALCESIARASDARVLPTPAHPAQLLGVMQQLEGMVAMRLHGAIFAAAQGTPVLCVAYDPKVDALANQLGAPRVGLERLESELLTEWTAFMHEREALRGQLQPNVATLQARAQELLERVRASLCPPPAAQERGRSEG